MKHKISKRIVLVLAVCVACVLGFGATFAHAADGDGGTTGTNATETNSLTLTASSLKDYLEGAHVQVRAYRIATGSKDTTYDAYNYAFDIPAFAGLKDRYNALAADKHTEATQWDELANAAKSEVVDQNKDNSDFKPDGTIDVTIGKDATSIGTMSNLQSGIYLIIVDDAQNATTNFTFTPRLVALPGKVGADNAPVYNSWEGEWDFDVTMDLKGGMTPRFGHLVIYKTVKDTANIVDTEPATFVFNVSYTDSKGVAHNQPAAIQYDPTSTEPQYTEVGHLPAGATVTVTEVNPGARHAVDGTDKYENITIVADDDEGNAPENVATVSFVNKHNGSGKVGYGIENHYVFTNGKWTVEQRLINTSKETTV